MATNIFSQLRAGLLTHSAEECEAAAAAFAQELPPDTTLALHGDLGVGKTTFVRGLARGLGIREPITSPTFSLYSLYRAEPEGAQNEAIKTKNAAREKSSATESANALLLSEPPKPRAAAPLGLRPTTLLHLDAYRLETAAEVEALLLEDFLQTPWCLAIEWPEKIPDWLPYNTLHLTLSIPSPHTHKIELH